MLDHYLEKFWNWLDLLSSEYAEKSCNRELEEYMFPQWNELQAEVYNCIDASDSESIENVLTAMAIDNEVENILDYLTLYAKDSYIDLLVSTATSCIYPQAKWQVAELISRRPTSDRIRLLLILMNDKSEYVRKRATNAFRLISEEQQKLSDC